MDWLVVTGSTCLGLLIGSLVGWFVNETEQMNEKVLATAVSVLSGAGVWGIFRAVSGVATPTREYWFYPIGLLVGFTIVTLAEIWVYGYDVRDKAGKKLCR
jgi:ABC-type transport system involved in multi-copper enzyme maturation permease subunit